LGHLEYGNSQDCPIYARHPGQIPSGRVSGDQGVNLALVLNHAFDEKNRVVIQRWFALGHPAPLVLG
jgi:hypothetical protein